MKNVEKVLVKQDKPKETSIVMPAVSSAKAVAAWKKYQELKQNIAEPSDIQKIEGKDFLKKSYWRKIATFFNLSTEVVEEHQEQIGKTFVWHFTIKAIAPNGRSAIGVGSCDAYEKAILKDGKYMAKGNVTKWGKNSSGKSYPIEFEWVDAKANSIHNIRSTAETRATNRAISNLVGGGEVSAEEVEQGHFENHDEQKNITEPTASEKSSWSNKCSKPDCEHPDWEVPEKVVDYSNKTFGRTVCYKCQEKLKNS